jgi:hypothetical protein
LAQEILERAKNPDEIKPVDSGILISSDIFLLGAAFYLGITMMSVYTVLFPPEQVLAMADLDRIVNDYRGVNPFFGDTLPLQVVKTMLAYIPTIRGSTNSLLEYINIPVIELALPPEEKDIPFMFPEITPD